MRCYLQEYLALKRIPVVAEDGDAGTVLAVRFRERGWKVTSVVVRFEDLRSVSPAELECSTEAPVTIRLRKAAGPDRRRDDIAARSDILEVGADELLGRQVLSSSDDMAGGSIIDLLINVHDSWVTGLSADDSAAIIDGLSAESLLTAPPYEGVEKMTPGYEDTIYRHYTHREFVPESS
jgi:hypothetical protein